MTVLKVLRAGHPILRKEASPVMESFINSADFERLVGDMFETMHDYEGVGLAAPQVQTSQQLLVFEIGQSNRYDVDETVPPTVLVNPEIVEKSDSKRTDWEGCLSFPELRGKVPRHQWIKVKALDENGESIERRFEGFTARAVQHEFDHLQGRLFPDRMESMDSLCFDEEYRRFHADTGEPTTDGRGEKSSN